MNKITIDIDALIFTYNNTEMVDSGPALGALFATEKLFFSDEGIFVNCSDVFAWGSADAEPLPISELLNLTKLFQKDQDFGAEMWCMIQRHERPQKKIEDIIRNTGKWDFDAFIKEHGLRDNMYDALIQIKQQYNHDLVNNWLIKQGKEPYNNADKNGYWYTNFWKPFITANPNYYNDDYKTELNKRLDKWKQEHGWK